jgi:hypothetical protein
VHVGEEEPSVVPARAFGKDETTDERRSIVGHAAHSLAAALVSRLAFLPEPLVFLVDRAIAPRL